MNHLMEKDAKAVIKLLSDLFIFAYMQTHEKMQWGIDNRILLAQGSDILFESEATSAMYIDQYLSQNHVSNFNRKIITNWRGAKKHHLYMMDEHHDVTLMYDKKEDTVYGVKGLTDALSFTLSEQTLPVETYYAILPYRDFYIVDALGITTSVVNLDEIIELYEGYRNASLHKPVQISKTETKELMHLARTKDDDINEVFMDYARPMIYYIQKMPETFEDIMQAVIHVWNDVNQNNEIEYPEEYNFIAPMLERKKKTFGQFTQIIEGCHLYMDQDGILKCKLNLAGKI